MDGAQKPCVKAGRDGQSKARDTKQKALGIRSGSCDIRLVYVPDWKTRFFVMQGFICHGPREFDVIYFDNLFLRS